MNKFTVHDKEYEIIKPTSKDFREAQNVSGKAFTEALEKGYVLRSKMSKVMESQGIWTPEDEEKYNRLNKQLRDYEYKLHIGGIPKGKLGDTGINTGFGLSMEIIKITEQLNSMNKTRISWDSNTAEGYAENMRLNYLVYACTVYSNNKERVFSSFEDFLDATILTSDNQIQFDIALAATSKYMEVQFSYNKDMEKEQPAYKFLLKYNFVDKDLKFIDKDGNTVDRLGRKINEFGFAVDAQGHRLDVNGRPIDEDGKYVEEEKPFLD